MFTTKEGILFNGYKKIFVAVGIWRDEAHLVKGSILSQRGLCVNTYWTSLDRRKRNLIY